VTVTRDTSGGELDVGAELSASVGVGTFGGGPESLDVSVPEDTRVTSVDVDDGSAQVAEVAGDIDDGESETRPL
jgi:hypothetical protein